MRWRVVQQLCKSAHICGLVHGDHLFDQPVRMGRLRLSPCLQALPRKHGVAVQPRLVASANQDLPYVLTAGPRASSKIVHCGVPDGRVPRLVHPPVGVRKPSSKLGRGSSGRTACTDLLASFRSLLESAKRAAYSALCWADNPTGSSRVVPQGTPGASCECRGAGYNGRVAQLGEHPAYIRKVAGSSPVLPT